MKTIKNPKNPPLSTEDELFRRQLKVRDLNKNDVLNFKRNNIKKLRKMKHSGKSKEDAYLRFPSVFVDENWK